jgi:peptidoglycan/xylan/chitin deacetylase (PgdA/CDA1 family)
MSAGSSQTERRVAMLAYHKVGEPPPGEYATWNYVPTAIFATHLRQLQDAGWQAIGLATLLRGLDDPDALPARSALITFDDGYRSTLTEALPWLQRLGWPGVVFVPTAYVGGWNTFDDGIEPREAICSWEELRELQRGGVSVQAHGVHHRWFSSLSEAEIWAEVADAKRALEAQLSTVVATIAYPYGDDGGPSTRIETMLARAGYGAGFLYKGGCARVPVADRYRVPRFAMGPDTNLEEKLTDS